MKKTVLLILLFSALTITEHAAAQFIINTIAGDGTYGFTGFNIAATSAELSYPEGTAVDDSGNLIIPVPEYNVVCKVNKQGIIFPIAGDGLQDWGFSGDGGPATDAKLHYPSKAAVDDSDNVYFIDDENNRIRKINTHGIITTVIGSSVFGFNGDSIADTLAEINDPTDLAIDRQNTIYFNDGYNHMLRKITTNGLVVTVAGTGVVGFSGDGGPATAAQLGSPEGIAVDQHGAIYFADTHRIRKIDASGIISTIAGTGVHGYSGDGGPATAAQLNYPEGVAVDSSGNVYFLDAENQRMRKIAVNGTISTVVGNGIQGYSGDGGPASDAELNYASGVTIDRHGDIYIADLENSRIREIAMPTGIEQLAVNSNQLSVYPNPTSNQITISDKQLPINEITITNVLGEIMYKTASKNLGLKTTIDVSGLPDGLYFVTVTTNIGTNTQKFLVGR